MEGFFAECINYIARCIKYILETYRSGYYRRETYKID